MKNLVKSLAGLFAVLILGASFVTCKQEVSGIEKSVIMINVVPPVKTTYGIGQSLDKTGMVVTAVWNDGTSQTVTDYTVTGFDSSKAVASQDITVTYSGKKASFRIKIIEIKPVSLTITKKPQKLVYTVGSSFDPTGMEVVCTYSDDSKKLLTEKEYEITGFDSSEEQKNQVVTVEYQNLSAFFTVTVTAATLESLKIDNLPSKTTYLLNEEFDGTGLEVSAVYSDGETQAITEYAVTGFDSTAANDSLKVLVEYGGKTAEFTVKVIDKSVKSLEIVSKPTKTTYYEEDSFDPAGLSVKVTYNDGTSEYTESYTSNFDEVVASAGTDKTVTLTFGKKTAEFKITVLQAEAEFITVTALPAKTTYYKNEEFDPEGMTVVAMLKNGTSKVITEYTTNFREIAGSTGKKLCLVTYQECVASFFVLIEPLPAKPVRLEITKKPAKLVYYKTGEKLNLDGMVVEMVYNNNGKEEKEVVEDYTTRGFDSSTYGIKTVTVIYTEDGFTYTASYECRVGYPTGIRIDTDSSKTSVKIGGSLSVKDVSCYLKWVDGSEEKLDANYTLEEFDSSTAGTQTVTVKYSKDGYTFTETYECEVVYPVGIRIDTENSKTTCPVGGSLYTSDVCCFVIWNNGSEERIYSNFTITGFDSSTAGTRTVTVNYTYGSYSFSETYDVKINTEEWLKTVMVQVMSESRTITGSGSSGVFRRNRTVTLSPYEIGKYEVTQELYKVVMGKNPSYFTTNVAAGEIQSQRPVEKVSWYDAITFCNKLTLLSGLTEEDLVYSVEGITDWLSLSAEEVPSTSSTAWDNVTINLRKKGYRLPTEAEWEFAARGGDTSASEWNYTYAGSDSLDDVAWYDSNSSDKTHQVGKKSPNSLGLYDMSGNVWEWCNDWYGSIGTGSETDPIGAVSGNYRCVRGGSWYISSYYCEVDYRDYGSAYYRNSNRGFRLARTAE